VQLENQQQCQQEIDDIKHGFESGSITYEPAKLQFTDEAFKEQKHCFQIADEKVVLGTQTYHLVKFTELHSPLAYHVCSLFWWG
jgi:inhibitor of growth protein 4